MIEALSAHVRRLQVQKHGSEPTKLGCELRKSRACNRICKVRPSRVGGLHAAFLGVCMGKLGTAVSIFAACTLYYTTYIAPYGYYSSNVIWQVLGGADRPGCWV